MPTKEPVNVQQNVAAPQPYPQAVEQATEAEAEPPAPGRIARGLFGPRDVMHLQRIVGNRRVGHMLAQQRPPMQRRVVGTPEYDAPNGAAAQEHPLLVASDVLTEPPTAPPQHTQPALDVSPTPPSIQRKPQPARTLAEARIIEEADGSLQNGQEVSAYANLAAGTSVVINNEDILVSGRSPIEEPTENAVQTSPATTYTWYRVLEIASVDVSEQSYFIAKDALREEVLIASMEALKELPKFQWGGSGAMEFTNWMEDEEDEVDDPTLTNCWNAILYAAFKAGLVDKAYIRRANEGRKEAVGPLLAQKIAASPQGCVRKNFQETDLETRQKAFIAEVKEAAPSIPRGSVVVFHSKGFHVCLSLGDGKVLELDRQPMTEVVNPKYNPNFLQERNKQITAIKKLEQQAKRKPPPADIEQKLAKAKQDFETWKENNQRDKTFVRELDNELREVMLEKLSYLSVGEYVDMDGVYWGPLPDL